MIFYIFLIALLNLGVGFAVAVYFGRSNRRRITEDPEETPSEPTSWSSHGDAEAARAALQAELFSRKRILNTEAEPPPEETDNSVAKLSATGGDA
ncbi:MAG: hypothetical protein JXB10_04855 [Pirellulales bacterium]|nr:hypothetical protein [Pirellulales bacterium]